MLLSPKLQHRKHDPKEPHFLIKGSMEAECLAASFVSYVDLGNVLMLFVSQFPCLKNNNNSAYF